MTEKKRPFKKPSKKHQPKGLTILHEDHDIIVVDKVAGLLTMATEREKQKTAYYLLTDYVRKGVARSKNRVFIVHRLDKDTSGILVFAKNPNAKNYLQENWMHFSKTYFAVVHGKLEEKDGIISSELLEDRDFKVSSKDDSESAKYSKTRYKVVAEVSKYSMLEINLLTGRKHQIRVHFSEFGHPIVGDKIYGNKGKGAQRLALHSGILTIRHPYTKEDMTFKTEIPQYFRTLVRL
jgi:tRNA pseudouridine32 synthase/23S rRNA pseudouridine746 synthase/23S rRNA pseudouridine1911/1915/1917 synthase